MASRYQELYNAWQQNPISFWETATHDIDWFTEPNSLFDRTSGLYGQWFAGGMCNTAYNCLDRHVERGRPGQTALIYDSPVSGKTCSYTYAELLEYVHAFSGVLLDKGIIKGDRVVIYMPMVPEAVIAMLACARIGAIHSVVFGGFASHELAMRIDDAQPKLVISASCGIEVNRILEYKPLLDEAIRLAQHKPEGCIILQRAEHNCDLIANRDDSYQDLIEKELVARRIVEPVAVGSTHPLYILYTSGTTGKPKGIVRDNGGHMVALKWSMSNIYGVAPGEVFWAASDIGWVVGHSYIVYAPLLHGCTTVLYEGKPVGTPDAGAFWRVIADHRVRTLFTAPTAFRAIKREDPDRHFINQYDLSSLRALFLAGEHADISTLQWAEDALGIPVIDHWWQTETGWPIVANPVGLGLLPIKYSSATVPMPGYDVQILDDAGLPVDNGTLGHIAIKLPLPPGCATSLWNSDEQFQVNYLDSFPGYYKTFDAGYKDDDGYIFILTRVDDIINVSGHRLSTGSIEDVIIAHPDIAECAVIGLSDPLKGQVPVAFVVLQTGADREPLELENELIAFVREKIGPVASFKIAIAVKRLPKTRSGKILRATIRKIANGDEYNIPSTIEDPTVLDILHSSLKAYQGRQ